MSEADAVEPKTSFNWRLLFAVLLPGPIAGMLAALILSVTVFADLQVYNPRHSDSDLTYYLGLPGVLFIGGFTGGLWGLLPMLFLGVPAHAWLLRNSGRQAWLYAVAGIPAGMLLGGFAGFGALGAMVPSGLQTFTVYLATGAVCGCVAGLVFWLIRRPDRMELIASSTS